MEASPSMVESPKKTKKADAITKIVSFKISNPLYANKKCIIANNKYVTYNLTVT